MRKLFYQYSFTILPMAVPFLSSSSSFQLTDFHWYRLSQVSFNDFHIFWSETTRIERLPATFTKSSDHFAGGHPTPSSSSAVYSLSLVVYSLPLQLLNCLIMSVMRVYMRTKCNQIYKMQQKSFIILFNKGVFIHKFFI